MFSSSMSTARPHVDYNGMFEKELNSVVGGRKREAKDSPQLAQSSTKKRPFFGKITRSDNKKQKKVVKLYRAPECYTMPINGVHVSLPVGLTPYRTQKLMMVRILQAIIRSQNALAESPTGSGKTMALLASSCAWLRQYKDKRLESKETCPVHSAPASASYKTIKEEDMSGFLTGPVDAPLPSSMAAAKFDDDDDISVVYDKSEDVRFNESMDRVVGDVDADFIPAQKHSSTKAQLMANEWEMENFEGELSQDAKERRDKCTCLPKVRIYYGTRTHKQIGQVVKEFGRLDHAPKLTHTILGSREQMCINDGARAHADVTGACKELISTGGPGCEFKSNMRGNYEKPHPIRQIIRSKGADVWDIDALVEALGEENGPQLCPYFSATRVLTQDADIIFCPFNYMIDPIIRDMSDVHMKNAVVILDEAHNVEDICRDAASFTFTEKEIHDALMSFLEKQDLVRRELMDQQKLVGDGENEEKIGYINKLKEYRDAFEKMVSTVTSIREWLVTVSRSVRDPKQNDRFDKGTQTVGWEHLWTSLEERRLIFKRDTEPYKEVQLAMMKLAEKDSPDQNNWTMEAFRPTVTALVCIEKYLYFLFYFTKEDRRSTYKLNITVERPTDAQLAAEAMHGMKKHGATQPYGMSSGPRNQLYHSQPATILHPENLFNARGAHTFVDPKNMPTAFSSIRPGLRITAHMWCMSPELAYMDAFHECRTVVLASGTLCPTETLKTELGMQFMFEMEGEQVIPREQIFASVITRGPEYRTPMRATYQNSTDDRFIEELGLIIRRVSMKVPGGVLVFFPSYRLLDRVYDWMFQATFIRQIEMVKIVVKEPRRSSELTEVMSQFEAGIMRPKSFGPRVTGSLMFAVFRGKVSEGIDFTDDMARAVISIGIPYPNAMDELVLEKKKYNNENATKHRILTGDQWYTSQAYRALNQGLGRCLRHRGDWGSIIMVDERLAVPRGPAVALSAAASAARVSRWIREQSVNYDAFGEFEADLDSFVERMTKPVVKKEIEEEIKQDIKKEMKHEIKQDIKKEMKHEIKQEIKQEIDF